MNTHPTNIGNPDRFQFFVQAPEKDGTFDHALEIITYDKTSNTYSLDNQGDVKPLNEADFQGQATFDVDGDGVLDPIYIQFSDRSADGHYDECHLFAVSSKTEDQLGALRTIDMFVDQPYQSGDVNGDGYPIDYVFAPDLSNYDDRITNADRTFENFLGSHMGSQPVVVLHGIPPFSPNK